MTSTNPSQLLLLADHIKLSLLERQRAISLNLPQNAQDEQISRSLELLQSGIEAAEAQLQQAPSTNVSAQITRLRQQFSELHTQFHGHAPPTSITTLPNDPSLAADFTAAQTTPARSSRRRDDGSPVSKSVRFRDQASSPDDPNRAALFPYRDDPDADIEGGPDVDELSNQQIHTYHREVIAAQDEQLDRLGESIGRQRELTMAIGDELDSQMMLLDEVDEGVDRHQGQLSGARKRLERFSRKARENWSMTIILVLIVILVLLIVIFK